MPQILDESSLLSVITTIIYLHSSLHRLRTTENVSSFPGGGGNLGSIVEGVVRGSAFVLFSFYVIISGMRPRSRLSSQLLTIPVP